MVRKSNLPIDEICERYLNENISALKLGEDYGVCETTILKHLKKNQQRRCFK